VLERFEKHFKVHLYESREDLSAFTQQKDVDLLYQITSGGKEDVSVIDSVPVFPQGKIRSKIPGL
jgi:hypothetical protein